MKKLLILGIVSLLAGCGEPEAAAPAARWDEAANTVAAADRVSSEPSTATRDDVVEATRCHLALSAAMASRIVHLGPTMRYGPAVTFWHDRIVERAQSAGLNEQELKDIRGQVLDEQRIEKNGENRAVLTGKCYEEAVGTPS